MITFNPFSSLTGVFSPEVMQMYVILMVILVIGGVVLDMMHKKSAKYFFENAKKAEKNAKRTVSGGEKVSLAVQTVAGEVLTSSEFENPVRRISHLLLMYGFIIFVVATATLIFAYPTSAWRSGELITDVYDLSLPAGHSVNTVTPLVIWYEPDQNSAEIGRVELPPLTL